MGSDSGRHVNTNGKGMGARHALSGYPPGTYWVRAATMRPAEESDFTGPVAVVVK